MSTGVVRSTALRAGGACVRCRKGKTKCVYENGRAPCKNCAKGMHECYLPSESMAHHHGQSPARHTTAHRPSRESLPASVPAGDSRAVNPASSGSRHVQPPEKLTPELIQECERVISKTYPACVAFHKPSFIQQLKNASLDPALIYALLTCAARSSPNLIRRYGGQSGATGAAEHFATKAMGIINQNLDTPSLAEIQAICLIIIHEWGSRNAVRAYIYLGQASRMVQMYRILHSHHAAVSEADRFLQEESFRRVLWLLYILDCLLTSTPGRHPALSSNDTSDVSLPCSDMNFAFGNAVFVQTINLTDPSRLPAGARVDDIGEFGQIVLATRIWRDVVQMLMTTTTDTFSDTVCNGLMGEIDRLRNSLSMQYVDKPGQINLHITMGSGFTYAMLHCMLHCASIFINRRRLLQYVTAPGFNLETWRLSPQCHEIIDRLFTSCHSTIAMLTALENGSDKDGIICFPIFMLFSSFTASATVAYLSLKGLTPNNAVETAAHIVRDGLHFMQDGVDTWPLISSWLRHLAVMHRVLGNDAGAGSPSGSNSVPPTTQPAADQASVKDEAASNADTNPDAMDYDQSSNSNAPAAQGAANNHTAPVSESGRDSEPPAPQPRRPGVATINGGSVSGTPASASPPPQQPEVKASPEAASQPTLGNGVPTTEPAAPVPQDMTASELCSAFERQLLELDDLAAFMGGGV
ncbi:fungal specific transcription factor domain-containing protein [Colletotrichum truncatum]|uniref:Fungal specific transcription factor domain-containing protein n=1 Tax=Colletotrichum truncatum TaxID=5467 RepID=A0ACC3ZLR2_COLTU|nr:fungal specific transcription factor domain-containing protein [Colletotrichum truncatum]KAF6786954.1 fungal specific transcription factor domain-containing protein [Colletotrichum truncatum]